MRFRPFKLLNDSERARIADSCTSAFDAWRAAWLAERSGTGSVSCAPAVDRAELALTADWVSFSASAGAVHVAHGQRALDVVRAAISGGATDSVRGGAEPREDDTVAANVVRLAVQDLAERLLGTQAARSHDAPLAETWRRGSGAAFVRLPLPRGELMLLLDPALVSKLLGTAQRTSSRLPGLANAQQCLGRQSVEVAVWLGSTEIELATFRTLSVNDVLILDGRIDHPLRVTVAGRDVAPRAVLGRTGADKAVRLTTHSPEM